MLSNFFKIELIKSVDKPMDINISSHLNETRFWVLPHNISPIMEYEINNELRENFDLMILNFKKYKESDFNTRTGYGKSRKNKLPLARAGEKHHLINFLEKHKQEIEDGSTETLTLLDRALWLEKYIGKDTINDFIIYMTRNQLIEYNKKLLEEIQENSSIIIGKVGKKEAHVSGMMAIYGFTFDDVGTIFLLPESILSTSFLDLKKEIQMLSKVSKNKVNIFLKNTRDLFLIVKSMNFHKSNCTKLIKAISKKREEDTKSYYLPTKNSIRNSILSNEKAIKIFKNLISILINL